MDFIADLRDARLQHIGLAVQRRLALVEFRRLVAGDLFHGDFVRPLNEISRPCDFGLLVALGHEPRLDREKGVEFVLERLEARLRLDVLEPE